MADEITTGHYNDIEGAQEHLEDAEYAVLRGGMRVALCDSPEAANTLAALLRFQQAMQEPGMWEGIGQYCACVGPEPMDCPTCRGYKALDTLRQALQQGRQG